MVETFVTTSRITDVPHFLTLNNAGSRMGRAFHSGDAYQAFLVARPDIFRGAAPIRARIWAAGNSVANEAP